MNRITYLQRGNSVGSSTWTCPAGVTVIFLQIMQGTTQYSQIRTIAVVPNTTYTITIASTGWSSNNQNTFGGLFGWSGGGRLQIMWTE